MQKHPASVFFLDNPGLHTAYKCIELNEMLQSLSPSQAWGFVNNASYNETTVGDKLCGPLATA
jgi:hypothetical protein